MITFKDLMSLLETEDMGVEMTFIYLRFIILACWTILVLLCFT